MPVRGDRDSLALPRAGYQLTGTGLACTQALLRCRFRTVLGAIPLH
jgi:hypothetical protein